MKKLYLTLFFALLPQVAMSYEGYKSVSFIKLTMTPKKYDKKKVIVSGFLVTGRNEPSRLYSTKDSYFSQGPDFLLLDPISEENYLLCSKKDCFVTLTGEFKFSGYGSPTTFTGGLIKIEREVVFKITKTERF